MPENDSSGMNAIVAIIGIVAILAVVYFAIQMFNRNTATPTQQPGINVNLGGGASTPSSSY